MQYNWIPLDKSADVMDLLASVDMHGIQTSGNCIRNITSDERAGIAVDEIADPRPFGEIMRQWSTLHPEFAFLPRKFKIAISGAHEDRAAIGWHDVGLHLLRNEAGELGFKVLVGGGMGRTPIIGTVIREFLPWNQIMNYLEAVVRVYNRYGRRDNIYKARIKILVKAEGQNYIDEVEAEYQQIIEHDGAPAHHHAGRTTTAWRACFVPPALNATAKRRRKIADILMQPPKTTADFSRWLQQNVAPHQNPDLRAVTLSFKRLGQAPGDATADQLDIAADLADRFSAGEVRVTHEQNLLLPWVRCRRAARAVARRPPGRLCQGQHPPADRHDRLPRRRLLRAGQCPLAADCRSHHRALPGPGRAARHRRDRPAHQRLHQLLRPPPQRPHRHPGRRQGRQGVVPGVAGRLGRLAPVGRGRWPARWSARRSRRPKCPT